MHQRCTMTIMKILIIKALDKCSPLFHAILNNLFAFMNQKLSPGHGGHFNSDPSRELIDVIEALQNLQANVKKS